MQVGISPSGLVGPRWTGNDLGTCQERNACNRGTDSESAYCSATRRIPGNGGLKLYAHGTRCRQEAEHPSMANRESPPRNRRAHVPHPAGKLKASTAARSLADAVESRVRGGRAWGSSWLPGTRQPGDTPVSGRPLEPEIPNSLREGWEWRRAWPASVIEIPCSPDAARRPPTRAPLFRPCIRSNRIAAVPPCARARIPNRTVPQFRNRTGHPSLDSSQVRQSRVRCSAPERKGSRRTGKEIQRAPAAACKHDPCGKFDTHDTIMAICFLGAHTSTSGATLRTRHTIDVP